MPFFVHGLVNVHYDFEAVVSKLYVGMPKLAKAFIGFGVGQIVGNVREPGATGIQLFDERQGLVDGLMHGMRNVAQGVDDQFIEIVQ